MKSAIYSWRVKAMLNYLKSMITDKDSSKEEILKVIDNYLQFTDETVDYGALYTAQEKRKTQRYPDTKSPWCHFIEGMGCSCGANVYHYEYDGENIYGVCNGCGKDLYIVKPEHIDEYLKQGVWI